MSKYFDKDFFKFFLGFMAIISLSLAIILAARLYQEKSTAEPANVLNSTADLQVKQ